MIFSIAALMLGSVCSAASIPRQINSSAPTQSPNFIVHSKTREPASYGAHNSLGYLFAEYSYPPGYSATLHTDKADAIAGYITDVNNPSNSTLQFPMSSGYSYGFKLYPLSEQYPDSLAQIYSGQTGTAGMAVVDGLLQWQAPDEVPITWVACPNWALEWGPATALFYKWSNTTTTEGCKDVDLAVEYV